MLATYGRSGPSAASKKKRRAAPALASSLGNELSVLLALLLIALGVGIRGLASAHSLFAGQILACAGIAVINLLLPGLVK